MRIKNLRACSKKQTNQGSAVKLFDVVNHCPHCQASLSDSPGQGNQNSPQQVLNDRIIRWPEFSDIYGISRTTAWRGAQENKLPKPRQIGPNSIGWLLSEVQAHIQALPVVESRNHD